MTLQGREDDGYTLSGKLLVTRNGGWCVCSVLTRGQVHQQVVASELGDVTSPGLGDGVRLTQRLQSSLLASRPPYQWRPFAEVELARSGVVFLIRLFHYLVIG